MYTKLFCILIHRQSLCHCRIKAKLSSKDEFFNGLFCRGNLNLGILWISDFFIGDVVGNLVPNFRARIFKKC